MRLMSVAGVALLSAFAFVACDDDDDDKDVDAGVRIGNIGQACKKDSDCQNDQNLTSVCYYGVCAIDVVSEKVDYMTHCPQGSVEDRMRIEISGSEEKVTETCVYVCATETDENCGGKCERKDVGRACVPTDSTKDSCIAGEATYCNDPCGDGVCSADKGETKATCPEDCADTPANDSCATAETLVVGTPANGTTFHASNNFEGYSWNMNNADVFYRFTLEAPATVTLQVSTEGQAQAMERPLMWLLKDDCSKLSEASSQIESVDSGDGDGVKAQIVKILDAGSYVVVVEGMDDNYDGKQNGNFTLSLSSEAYNSQCGDGFCFSGETVDVCPQDCAQCGDGICSADVETIDSCPKDCNTYAINSCGEYEDCTLRNIIKCPLCQSDASTLGYASAAECQRGECFNCAASEAIVSEYNAREACMKENCASLESDQATFACMKENCAANCMTCGDGLCSVAETAELCPEDCAQ